MYKRNIILVFVLAVMALMLGCSENKIVVTNDADEMVWFHFRGDKYALSPSGTSTAEHPSTRTLSDIPNGTYAYNTTYIVPRADINVDVGPDLSGQFSFQKNETKITILYESITDSNSYNISLTYSTSNNLESTATGY